MELLSLLVKMIVFLFVLLYGANQLLRYLNNRTLQQGGKTLQVLERISVSKTSGIGIVKILDSYYVMSLSEQNNQIMKELTEEEVEKYLSSPQFEQEIVPKQFSQLIQKQKEQLAKRKRKSSHEKEN
ncbi:flagellar biosynthetic protein FliO [Enterococcus olivae]